MGVYVYRYTVSSPVNVRLPTGEKVVLAHYKYAYKPFWCEENPTSWETRDARAQKIFDNRKTEYFYIGDSPKEGLEVRSGPTGALWYDCDYTPGILLGWLKKHGNRWYVSTTMTTSHISTYLGKEDSPSEKISYLRMVSPGVYEQMNTHPLAPSPGKWIRYNVCPKVVS